MNTIDQTASGNSTPMPSPHQIETLINENASFKGQVLALLSVASLRSGELMGCPETLEKFFHAFISSEQWEFEEDDKAWIVTQYKIMRALIQGLDGLFKQFGIGEYQYLLTNKNSNHERN